MKTRLFVLIGIYLSLMGCTYNHYYQEDSEMVPTPTGDAAIAEDSLAPGKVIIYRVH